MVYLALSILCSTLVTIIFKLIEDRQVNLYAIISINYLSALLVSLVVSVNNGTFRLINIMSLHKFLTEWENVFKGMYQFSAEASAAWALIIGIAFGPAFCLAFFRYQKGIIESGMGITNIFMKMSVIIPMFISMIIWEEIPSIAQIFGIILCIISIVLFNLDFKNLVQIKLDRNLILLTILGGMAQFTAKIYQEYGIVNCKDLLTFFIFTVAFITSLFYLFKNDISIGGQDLIIGIGIGVPNLLSTTFLVLALNHINTSKVYLVSGLLSILLVLIIGVMFFEEKLHRKDLIAVGISLVAIYLIN